MKNYKRAPGRAEDHPDWFWSLSGGIDSVAAFIITLQALRARKSGGNWAKKPVAIYLDTGVGVPLNRLYVEQLCDWAGVMLSTWRTDESFLEWLRRSGAPGSGAHQEVKNELKGRQSSKLTSLADKPVYVLSIAADESDVRAGYPKVREVGRHVEVYPVHRLTRKERVEIILRSDCPRNPLWTEPRAIKDCGCLCNGDPSEKEKTKELFPAFGQRLDEWEEAITHEFPKDTLGWNGLTADEQAMEREGLEQTTLTTCGVDVDCQSARDPAEVRAFEADARGAPLEESLSILYEGAGMEEVP